ncbi:MAG: ComF family protein [Flavobacteriales bacterium]
MISTVVQYLNDFSHLAFPFNCFGCNVALDEGEEPICNHCKEHMPLTRYWEHDDNAVEKLFWGKIQIERAAAYSFFTKGGIVQSLMHQLKYNGKIDVGLLMGRYFGEVLKDSMYDKIDLVVPVPLHASKLKKRGYNQCDFIARGIAESMGKPYNVNCVARIRANETQTKKGIYERWINVKELFKVVEPQFVRGKHVLLIDDVVTTGSTLEACAGALLQVPDTRVSIATIACPAPF